MSALDELHNKRLNTKLELCVLYWGDPASASDEEMEEAEEAAEELAALHARVEELEGRLNEIAKSIKVTLDDGSAPDNIADHVELLMLQEYYPAMEKIRMLTEVAELLDLQNKK